MKTGSYYGAICNGKRAVRSYKNKTIDAIPADEWIIVENTHTAIISKERWEQAQALKSKNKKTVRTSNGKGENIFAGIIKCGKCGGNMTYKLRENKTCPSVATFRCATWIQKGNEACDQHSISYDVIYKTVLADVNQYAILAEQDEERLINEILKANHDFTLQTLKRLEKTILENKNRIKQIDKIFQSSYEDKVNGVLTDVMFKSVTGGLETERQSLSERLEVLEEELCESKLKEDDLSGWVDKIKSCLRIEELTRTLVIELIDCIVISETIEDGKKAYDISIKYRFGAKK